MTPSKPIVIAAAADDNYAPYLTIAIHSALRRIDRRHAVHVFVLDGGISPENRLKLKDA